MIALTINLSTGLIIALVASSLVLGSVMKLTCETALLTVKTPAMSEIQNLRSINIFS